MHSHYLLTVYELIEKERKKLTFDKSDDKYIIFFNLSIMEM